MTKNELKLVGCASGLAGADIHSGDGPLVMQQSPYLSAYSWEAMIRADATATQKQDLIGDVCKQLAVTISELVKKQQFFSVIGGDHTCAIGTWSGVYDALHHQGDIGLIWFDAHMDAHTPETTESGHIHGMPLAALMGYGFPELTSILHHAPKIKPENLVLLGVRSFESGEAALLKRLGIRVYYMDEIKQRGFVVVPREAVQHVKKNTIGYGFSLDLDGIDPIEAPGVDVPEPDGVKAADLFAGLREIVSDPKLIATEIVEFDPLRDKNKLTEKMIGDLVDLIAQRK